MTDKLALLNLYDLVAARFADEGTEVSMAFGWRKPTEKLLTGPAIVWAPGDTGGAIGEIAPPRNPGRLPARPLATVHEHCTVIIQSRDPSAPEDERLQYQCTRLLFDAWYRAVYLAAYGTFEVLSAEWMQEADSTGMPRNLRRAGAAIRVVLAIQSMVPDAKLETVTGAGATVDVEAQGAVDAVTIEVGT